MNIFYLEHGHGTSGPFRTESVTFKESGAAQKRRGKVTATRFMVSVDSRWYRVYSDHTHGLSFPHFINFQGARIRVNGVSP